MPPQEQIGTLVGHRLDRSCSKCDFEIPIGSMQAVNNKISAASDEVLCICSMDISYVVATRFIYVASSPITMKIFA